MKKLCLFLALVMILSVLAGCTKDGGGNDTGNTAASNGSGNGVEISVASNFVSTDSNGQNFLNAYKSYEQA